MEESNSKVSLILSVLALIVSVASFGYTVYVNEHSKVEDLSVYTSSYLSDYKTEIIQQNVSGYPAVLPTIYECTLINEGEKPINIINYDLQQISSPIVYYSYMDMGLFDKERKQIDLPLNIKPHESYKFYLYVGLLIDPNAFKIINNSLVSKNEIKIMELNKLLAKNGMDIYGNPSNYTEIGGGNIMTIAPNRSQQIFLINFLTSHHNTFSDSFSWYMKEKAE